MVDVDRREQRGREALRGVQQHARHAQPRPKGAPDVGRADVPAADGADVDAAEGADEPVPGRDASREVARDYAEESRQVVIWYRLTQSLTVSQSRLLKNASMYELRS